MLGRRVDELEALNGCLRKQEQGPRWLRGGEASDLIYKG